MVDVGGGIERRYAVNQESSTSGAAATVSTAVLYLHLMQPSSNELPFVAVVGSGSAWLPAVTRCHLRFRLPPSPLPASLRAAPAATSYSKY